MKKLLVLVLVMVFLLGAGGRLLAQPEATGYTLSDIYYYLTEGTEATWGNHSLEPQSGVPGQDIAGFSQSMEDIYYYMAEAFNHQSMATYVMIASNLDDGYYFFSTDKNYWGLRDNSDIPWELNETSCNALSGWHWYTTNGRSACWSKALADSVSWNKGVGNDTDNPGTYTAATGYTLEERMKAAAAGEWYKIVSKVNGTTITSSHNGSSGYSVISALAIADCVDGTRDLCSTNGCLGSSWSGINTSLRSWAGAAGKSALPYLANDGGSSGNNDFETACGQNSGQDRPLGGTDSFYLNRKVSNDGDTNYCWAAACGSSSGGNWAAYARALGYDSCSYQFNGITSHTYDYVAFRVVVRPAAE